MSHSLEIPDNKYLGKLCPKGHEWEGTGKSLLYKSTSGCFLCTKELCQKTQKGEEYKRKKIIYSKEYRRKNKEKLRIYSQKYRESKRGKANRKILSNIFNKRNVKELKDNYIKQRLCENSILKHNDIPQE